nr:pyridoxal phosphate-dependent aminotransferase [Pseudomonas luteola]
MNTMLKEIYVDENKLSKDDITQHEIEALKTKFNLADAHTHQSQSPTQRNIIKDLPKLWYKAEKQTQYESEQEFIQTFYTFHGQHTALKRKEEIYLVYAASIAMHITATYLKQKQLRVGLIEPCFDNLHDLMKHMEVPLSPLDESIFGETASIYKRLSERTENLDAIFVVDPNNPTGFSLFKDDAEAFREVVRFCKDHKKILIMDFCFASFILANGNQRHDAYEILEESGVDFIAMEDTGKTWPLQDAKCATLMTSKSLNDQVYPILTSVLLNVSPFILNVVTQYIKDSATDNFSSVRNILKKNRETARNYLHGKYLTYCDPEVETSVAWFKINIDGITADTLHEHLLSKEIYVLPGKYFYWNDPEKGQKYIRIALARDHEMFEQAMVGLKYALETYNA